jgi:DNA repair protein RecN (Recombination protein N)
VDHLDAADRRDEIARMLAGATVTDAARRAADQLLTAARAATGAGESKHKAKAKP